MFCPMCAEEMVEFESELYCVRGDMMFSFNMRKCLSAVFMERSREPANYALSYVDDGTWFCPRDASPMVEEDGSIACTECDLPLTEFVVSLRELHPHNVVV